MACNYIDARTVDISSELEIISATRNFGMHTNKRNRPLTAYLIVTKRAYRP